MMSLNQSNNGGHTRRTSTMRRVGAITTMGALAVAVYGTMVSATPKSTEAGPAPRDGIISFTDARQQAAEFMSYDRTIILTPEQKQLMDTALSSIPAPCCSRYSIATCCCPCNLAKSTWGLAKFLIARHQANADEVKSAALKWLQFTNPDGYTGDACFTGGCERPFDRNGCGGMHEDHIN